MKGKKLLVRVLSAAMVLGAMAFPAFAEENPGTDPAVEEFMNLKAQSVNDTHEIDLNGAIVNVDGEYWSNIYADITIKNGTINFSDFDTPDGIFRVGYYNDTPVTLTLEKMNINVTNAQLGTGVFNINSASKISITDSNITVNCTQEDDVVGVFYAGSGLCGDINIQNSAINTKKANAVFYCVNVNVEDSTISVTDNYKPVFRGAEGVVEDTTVTVVGQLGSDNRALIQALDSNSLEFVGNTTITTGASTPFVTDGDEAHITVSAAPTVTLPASAAGVVETIVAKVDDKYYTSIAEALTDADDTDNNGVITYEIYGKVVLPDGGIRLGKEGITTINFTQGSEDAELSLEGTGLNLIGFDHAATLKAINYTGLKLSRLNGSYVGDAAHLNQFFTTTIRTNSDGIVTYTDCTFPNGSGSNTYGKTVYNNCIFSNEDAGTKYNVWIRGGKTEINGGTVKGAAGIKLYSDDPTKVFGDTKINGVNFENITTKPAIVATQQGKIEITNSTVSNCEYGLIANESNRGAALANITVDGEAPAYVSSVNGNLYTASNYAEKEAQANGTEAKKVVAKVGDKFYTTLKDAFTAACNMNVADVNGIPTQTTGVTIDLLADIENQEGFSAYGGEPQNRYGWHFAHNVDITLNGNGHKIDTGVHGSNNADTNKSPNINVSSNNGKFTVKNVIAPNDLLFTVTKPGHATSDCKDEARAESLVVENCEFYGSNVGYDSTVNTVMYKNNKFLLTENENDHPDAYPLWYKFDWKITNFTFEGNTVKSQRALNLARFSQDSEIVINNNNFTIANSETPAKSAAIMLAENNTEQYPYNGNVTFNGNTVDAHSAVLVYAPSEYNTNFNLTAESNILANGTKLVGYNEWSGSYNDQAAKEAAEALVKKVETNANGGSTVADTLKLTFIKHTDDERVYDIVLNGAGKDINRLNAAEFEFELSNAAMTYEIKAADKLTTLQPAVKKYVFYFDGKDAINNADTGSEITIGTVTFDGFGVFTFKATAGKATATTTADNLVTEFVTTAAAGKGTLKIGEDGNMIKDAEIKVPTQKLTVNVAMEHNVGDNTAAYQDMTVAISGGDLAENVLEYKLGDAANTAITKAMNGTMVASYQIKTDLTKDRIYTVTVSGAGYRTSRYTVTMTEDKTMNFWNNDKTNEVTVIDDEKAKTTFLAGELVRDGKIDIYDLSAVVAYFGQKNIDRTQASKFAKYDLNRDGEIDIMDISIVLTSWGK